MFLSPTSPKKPIPEVTKDLSAFFQGETPGSTLNCDSSTQPGDAQIKTNTQAETEIC